jgi:hypothetical protein
MAGMSRTRLVVKQNHSAAVRRAVRPRTRWRPGNLGRPASLGRLGAAALGLALATALTATAPAQAESNGGVRVMPLGDSITDGAQVPGGYRINLWQRTAGAVDFVGSGFNGPAGLGDHDHEGHSGWRIDQLDTNIVTWL